MINEALKYQAPSWNSFTLKLAEKLKDGFVNVKTRQNEWVTIEEYDAEKGHFIGTLVWGGEVWFIDGRSPQGSMHDLMEMKEEN